MNEKQIKFFNTHRNSGLLFNFILKLYTYINLKFLKNHIFLFTLLFNSVKIKQISSLKKSQNQFIRKIFKIFLKT
jgi:hypothetical protein